MNRNKTIDLKKYGMLEDIKEAKGDKGFAKALASKIHKIKQEGTKREESHIKYISGLKEKIKEGKRLNLPTATYNEQVREHKRYISGSKIESGVHMALESSTAKLGQQLKQRVISRKILKPNKIIVHIPDKKIESSWDDENRYFKGQFNKEKRSMFLE